MSLFAHDRLRLIRRKSLFSFLFFLLLLAAHSLHAASVRGILTDTTGARVTGAKVSLVMGGKAIATAVSSSDGSFQLLTGDTGHMFLMIGASGFRQLATPDFYAGKMDSIERNLVLEPAWVRQSIVVAATGMPTPQQQSSSATTVLGPVELDLPTDLVGALRSVPGVVSMQTGQLGSATSIFIRGGGSSDNKVLMDGIDASDLGNQIDFGPLSNTGIESVEIYRGPNSNLYGAGAMTGVINITTPHGTTSFPSILFSGGTGNFHTSHERLEVAGAHNKFDYLGAFSWLQTANALPHDQHHAATTVANLGWQPVASTLLRGTLHYGVASTGVPNSWDFYHIADDATEKKQSLVVSASVVNHMTASFQNTLRYGLTRKREQDNLWSLSGTALGTGYYATYGDTVTITGANGYSVTGRAGLDYSLYHSQYVSNRDQLNYQGDLTITPHLYGTIGFVYTDERGAQPGSSYYPPVQRNNYDYFAAVHGDFKSRFFYTLGGSLEHYTVFGTETTPRAGVSYYALRPRTGVFSGTRLIFNYGDAVREPKLTDQDYSLYTFLSNNGGQATIAQMQIKPMAAPHVRTYEAGFEQSFLSSHLVFRTTYFHNQFNRELESVGVELLPELLPGLSSTQISELQAILYANNAYTLTLNSAAYRAQGVETSVESGLGRNFFLRGGYTYVDAVVQRSFTSDNEALLGGYAQTFEGIPVGAYTPLKGARPFRRPPHTGFFTATYSGRKLTALFGSSYASRSDDSTFLSGSTPTAGDLLLPNRNLDHGFAKLDLGGSYQILSWLGVYTQMENLLSQQHIAPIGYPSLPMTFRSGLRFQWGPGSGR